MVEYQGKDETTGRPWEWNLNPTYHIGILAFDFEDVLDVPPPLDRNCWFIWSGLFFSGDYCLPKNPGVFLPTQNDLLNICLVSLPKFKKLVSDPLKPSDPEITKFAWMLANFGTAPTKLVEPWVFGHLQVVCDHMKIRSLSSSQQEAYDQSLKSWKDEHDAKLAAELKLNRSRAEGIAEGRAEGRVEGLAEGIAKTVLRLAENNGLLENIQFILDGLDESTRKQVLTIVITKNPSLSHLQ